MMPIQQPTMMPMQQPRQFSTPQPAWNGLPAHNQIPGTNRAAAAISSPARQAVNTQLPTPTFMPSPVPVAATPGNQQPKLVIRAQGDDAPARPSAPAVRNALSLPTPEELGLVIAPNREARPATENKLDWNEAHARLQKLGAVGFHLVRLDGQGFRATFALPTGQTGQLHMVEATAANEAAAVLLALQRAETWAASR